MKVFEDMFKTDSKTGKRKSINVQKSFDDGKVAGVRTEYRHKKVGKNGGWKGRISDYEGNQWLPKRDGLVEPPKKVVQKKRKTGGWKAKKMNAYTT